MLRPIQSQITKKMTIGKTQESRVCSAPLPGTPVTLTPFASSFSAKAMSTRAVTNKDLPLGSGFFNFPWIVSAPTETSATWPAASNCSNWL
jgi:hypothetical protein